MGLTRKQPGHNQPMQLHSDLSVRVVVDTHDVPWTASPSAGVERRMLERDGGEVARATSVVRYEPGCRFTAHRHDLGEEFLVLSGVFEDEFGRYPAGTYVKNPPGSSHAPGTDEGCVLFVKLRHLQEADTQRVVVDTRATAWRPGLVAGLSVMPLSAFGAAHTALVRWAPGTHFARHTHWGGEEIFVVDGIFEDEHGVYPQGTWLRSPHLSAHEPRSMAGCMIFVKTGHL